ncbi:nitrilase-related carbon-nitrogen hydrolase [Leptospira kirschneri]|uniref:nitrilase-related carbon-nitrogen hydrolase n=1 Tax=Leptospira kirschneri TaxID=29507 RepID=UPI0002BE109A|nr:nitrilase-related carbon-nitrogen hydrolase [Leptospira kirschneri]EMO81384.1 hydrolase, carbon-nitrogen family [Leptospira kirschneri str. 200801774]EPG50906.1 hydrolase, carbon-nitrogen family [Leptospira kirschneri serovar Cynopteri str. 3522 CT]KON76442.1 Hydrolase, carbon-nitrogen family [Leptospira kirschneri serovar Mozdok]KPZ76761.1 nitrilase [Leptospira kirschneri serovar Mozdok]NDK05545.1 Hydrolase, carbon-nitrogen family [Leptospira kirschneri serovar Mozdok]
MKIALVSLNIKWEDKAYNLEHCKNLICEVVRYGVDLVIFPEMTLTGFSMNTEVIAEDPGDSPSIDTFQKLAKENCVAIVFGLVLKKENKALNTLVFISKDGIERIRYDKVHPFSFATENKYFEGGRNLSKLTLSNLTFGFTICYDLRFPELYSALAKDCDVLVNIANWPEYRKSHWRILSQARAIENQTYFIGVNRTGIDGNDIEYEKSSIVVDANGEFIFPEITSSEIDIFEIKKELLLSFRNKFLTRQDRIPEFYKTII